jgi:catechol 2,3-dioxygenase-like lactoylglutathione lyase family enzyme
MITNISLTTIYCTDQTKARDFYVNNLGFEARVDIPLGGDYRWVTIGHPSQPELDCLLLEPGPPLAQEIADVLRTQLEAGTMPGIGLKVDDCKQLFVDLSAKGVKFIQEPTDKPHGVEAIVSDGVGNMLVVVEPKAFDPANFS